MSYCRFGYGSDCYVFACSEGFCCQVCLLNRIPWDEQLWLRVSRWWNNKGHLVFNARSWYCDTPEEMIEHLLDHRYEGHDVPNYALARLAKEAWGGKDED